MLDLPLTFMQRPAASGTPKPWLLVLMHGVGSNEHDMFEVAAQIPERFYVLSLRAPNRMGPGSHAWFDFVVEPGGVRTINQAQEAASRALVAQVIEAASLQLDIPPDRVVLGGFSQGGTMALSLLLTRPDLVHAAMVWHGRLLPEVLPLIAPHEALHGRKLWVSHGTHDGVVPVANAQSLRRKIDMLPVSLTYREFPSAHEVRPAELGQTVAWLENLGTVSEGF